MGPYGFGPASKLADKALIEPGGKPPDLPHAVDQGHLIDTAHPSRVVVEGGALVGRVVSTNNPRPCGELARIYLVAHDEVVPIFDPGNFRSATKDGELRTLHRPLAEQVGERGQRGIDSSLRHRTTSYVIVTLTDDRIRLDRVFMMEEDFKAWSDDGGAVGGFSAGRRPKSISAAGSKSMRSRPLGSSHCLR